MDGLESGCIDELVVCGTEVERARFVLPYDTSAWSKLQNVHFYRRRRQSGALILALSVIDAACFTLVNRISVRYCILLLYSRLNSGCNRRHCDPVRDHWPHLRLFPPLHPRVVVRRPRVGHPAAPGGRRLRAAAPDHERHPHRDRLQAVHLAPRRRPPRAPGRAADADAGAGRRSAHARHGQVRSGTIIRRINWLIGQRLIIRSGAPSFIFIPVEFIEFKANWYPMSKLPYSLLVTTGSPPFNFSP